MLYVFFFNFTCLNSKFVLYFCHVWVLQNTDPCSLAIKVHMCFITNHQSRHVKCRNFNCELRDPF